MRAVDMGLRNCCMALVLLGSSTIAVAELIPIEKSVEALQLEVRVDQQQDGYAIGRECNSCDAQRFTVTPETEYRIQGRPVEPDKAYLMNGKPGTIIYDIKTRLVTRIHQY